ncbi:tannase/feruloyl esterase family alpha/beta hydrolase [Streptomyces ferrugineus]|uniref:Tannase/feruloyl esterase family alpha/beta hydrolase n=1 Tax=Streptomyces ferrugineus TaxID=1413221 RepID=A0A7M2SE38_9ACTN|nr:tannase/feruloyl esterase family alpha/beta hydrolase [Streptomyces ferrugineus]QOV34600.1 tannase/feruloyl esterase family alpha/beta hydrolase [Streptomyces ferrugineus]
MTPCGTITAKDAAVVKKIWDGPRRPDGTRLRYGILPGASFARLAATSNGDGVPTPLASGWFTYWLAKNPSFDWHSLTMANFTHYFDQSHKEWAPLSAKTEQFARLFTAPGVGHCRGGSGAAPPDPLAALVKWVEQDKAPHHAAR